MGRRIPQPRAVLDRDPVAWRDERAKVRGSWIRRLTDHDAGFQDQRRIGRVGGGSKLAGHAGIIREGGTRQGVEVG